MNRRRTATLSMVGLICALAVSTAWGEGRWRRMPIRMRQQALLGLPGGEGEQHMHSMARSMSNPDIIYMSHDVAQVWRSNNGGRLWHKTLGDGMFVHAGQSIEVDPVHANVVLAMVDATYNFISEGHEGLYRSTDYGESWDLVLQVNNESQRIYQRCIAYDPAAITPDGAVTWYLGVLRDGLYRSDNYGVTWMKVGDLSDQDNVYAVHAHISDNQTVYVGTNNGLYRSTSRGMGLHAWGNLPPGRVTSIAMHPTDPDTMYAVVQGVGLYRSTNGGQTFTSIRDTNATGVFVNPGHPHMIYLARLSGALHVSDNGGASWFAANVVTPPGFEGTWKNAINGAMTGLSPDPRDPDVAMGYSHASFWRTENGGRTFVDSSGLFTGYNMGWWYDGIAYDVEDPHRFAFFCADVGMVITEDGGWSWSRRSAPYDWYTSGQVSWRGMHASTMYPETGSELILGSIGMYWDCRVFRTTDAGRTDWTLVETTPENYLFIEFNTDDPTIVYAGNRRSTDGGLSFSPIPYLDNYNASIMGMCRAQPDTIYAIARPRNRIFRSDDAGVTWRQYVSTSWSYTSMDSKPAFAVDPQNPDVIYTMGSTRDLARYDGTSWTNLGVVGLPGPTPYRNFLRGVAIDPRHPEIIYAQLFTAGFPFIYRSTDYGQTWEDISHNLSRTGTGSINVHPLTGDVFYSNGYGTWVYPPLYASPDSVFPNCAGEPPIARAGGDRTVIDGDGSGFALILLDGTASTAPDTGIVEYLWSKDGMPLGFGAQTHTALATGVHTILLRVTDSDGIQATDTAVITVVSRLPGDANGDGKVDLEDFVILKTNFGMTTGATWAHGDFDGDGAVDLDDFTILKNNFGG